MQVVSLFSGIGGFELAAEWMGWGNIASCEINPFGQKILKHYWPNSYHHDNIKTLDYEKIKERICPKGKTIVVGGFPCQPYSLAGKRLGKQDERHLWPYCIETVKQLQPDFCVFENVFGLVNWSNGLVFHEVQTDLEAEGYEVWPYVLPACAVNAPHRRDRVWFIAYRNVEQRERQTGRFQPEFANESTENTTNCSSEGLEGQERWYTEREGFACHCTSNATNTSNERLERCEKFGSIGIKRKNGNQQSARCFPSTWQNFPTQSPICDGNDGISARLDGITFSKWRNESIKAAGNAIVPQVALQIFKAIEQYENL